MPLLVAAAALFERLLSDWKSLRGGSLTGWFLRAESSRRRKPLVIVNNGADGWKSAVMYWALPAPWRVDTIA